MTQPVLIIDDSELILQMLEMVCQQAGYRVVSAIDFEAAREIVSRETPSVILTDLNLPDTTDPVASLRKIPKLRDVPIILISGRPQDELEAEAEQRGADGAISKDAGMDGMAAHLPKLLEAFSA